MSSMLAIMPSPAGSRVSPCLHPGAPGLSLASSDAAQDTQEAQLFHKLLAQIASEYGAVLEEKQRVGLKLVRLEHENRVLRGEAPASEPSVVSWNLASEQLAKSSLAKEQRGFLPGEVQTKLCQHGAAGDDGNPGPQGSHSTSHSTRITTDRRAKQRRASGG